MAATNGKRVMPVEHKIPHQVLDLAARTVSSRVGYAYDTFLDYDWECVRSLVGQEFASVPLSDVRRQTINRRKCGAIRSEKGRGQPGKEEMDKECPQWYKDYLATEWWQSFRLDVLRFWGHCALCGVEASPQKVILDVHHNRYRDLRGDSLLGRESLTDCVCLCQKCHKRHHKYNKPPGERPR